MVLELQANLPDGAAIALLRAHAEEIRDSAVRSQRFALEAWASYVRHQDEATRRWREHGGLVEALHLITHVSGQAI